MRANTSARGRGQAIATLLTPLDRFRIEEMVSGSSADPEVFQRSVEASAEQGPMAVWWGLEDLWVRLAMHAGVSVECERDWHVIVLHGVRSAGEGSLRELHLAATDPQAYRWHAQGQSGSFVQLLHSRDEDLVCTLAGLHTIERWPDGRDLVWQVKSLLLRLKGLSSQARARRGLAP
jgi:hypothetical protein